MTKNLLRGGIEEDEKEAFEYLCENYGLEVNSVKAPGSHLNKLMALCKKIKLKLIVDFTVNKFSIEYDKFDGATKKNDEENLSAFVD